VRTLLINVTTEQDKTRWPFYLRVLLAPLWIWVITRPGLLFPERGTHLQRFGAMAAICLLLVLFQRLGKWGRVLSLLTAAAALYLLASMRDPALRSFAGMAMIASLVSSMPRWITFEPGRRRALEGVYPMIRAGEADKAERLTDYLRASR
jgi:hypothetical protein